MLKNLNKEETRLLANIIGPCLDRKILARFFYGDLDLISQKEIIIHIIWCKNCQLTFNQYLEELEEKISTCPEDGYFESLFAEQRQEKLVTIIHTIQCESCLRKYMKARGENKDLDQYEERAGKGTDPIQKLIYLRHLIMKRLKGESYRYIRSTIWER